MKVKVSKRFQIAVPAEVRKQLGIKAGDNLLVNVRDGLIYLRPEPEDWEKALRGLHKEIWEGIDPKEYIRREREVCQD